ncbi:PadR family transcriptional regulator [Brevundimonas subvibrioides]|uniref:Transcriptional regulator, PadR-like family n=1 Tax=Brevundimonas subvibrioides (strain ATCC 15264 / DSM 4735 / LMG 14903 / NBRC 16000 / CB 81) TaxID=633149 RepID=D9QG17_BRESC|nr:PadR family transcriptional regulator [Brevundimonas subvibrioides]ADL02559.1 transcriptional regulator, PadR-like family [Brevundimonas subvibrioides ATCC 15264]
MFGFNEDTGGLHGRHEHHGRHRCGPAGEGRGPRGEGRGAAWAAMGRGFGSGREGEGRGPGRGRRMFGPGDLRLVLLALIEQEPRHGYDLIKAIETAFGGGYAPSPGVVYPTLSLLADEGLIAGVEDTSGKRIFTLTPAGQTWLDENRTAVDGVMQRMALAARLVSGEQTPEVVREAFHTLRHAVQMKPGNWSEAETARVVEALMRAVRDISEG